MKKITLQTDWWSRWNPWKSWWWWIAFDEYWKVLSWSRFFWIKTNNESEFLAIINWVKEVYEKYPNCELFIEMDSNMIINQINKNWKVKKEHLKPLYSELMWLLDWKTYNAKRIPREKNTLADSLANYAMDNN